LFQDVFVSTPKWFRVGEFIGGSGALEPKTAKSTRPIASTVTHAGIVKVNRYAFGMP